jgi:DNA helicase-2/ATP-dependent DNA helicase PcrA
LQTIDDIINSLNPSQKAAATVPGGPVVVFAGAGSGKTRIITARIAWLIEQGVKPWEIVAVTFTNKAAAEMKERVRNMSAFGERVLITTFHSACARWLREFGSELGFTSDFSIYDDQDSTSLIKSLMKTANIKLDKESSAAEYRSAINQAKTLGLFPSDAVDQRSEFENFMPFGGIEIYRAYQESLALSNAMDFGDLITNMLLLLRTNERVRAILQARFRHILVDEYQDTNKPQIELVSTLAAKHNNLFVVGDDDQSIYSWRGAVPSNILNFDKIFPQVQIFKLEQNYRCTANIVNAAAALVANNKKRADKTLRTDNVTGEPITLRFEVDGDFEAWWVAKSVSEGRSKFAYDQTAIFYRTNSQSRAVEDALRREDIPYRIYGTVRFYDRMEVKDLVAYLRLLVNPRDDISLKRAINTPTRGIGDSAVDSLEQAAKLRGKSMYDTMNDLIVEGVPRLSSKLATFQAIMDRIKSTLPTLPLADVVEYLLDATQYVSYLKKKFPEEAEDKIDNIRELASAMAEFAEENRSATIAEWIQSVTLSSEESGDEHGVTLMTLHMAKGLEFDRVYVIGLEDGLLPHFNSIEDPMTLEEERRLLYVGMTRARKELSLSCAYRRRLFGNWTSNPPSRFLREVPKEFMTLSTDGSSAPSVSSLSHFGTTLDEPSYEYDDDSHDDVMLEPGASVRHPTYGVGTVEELELFLGMPKAVVNFREFGRRRVNTEHLSGA